VPPFDAVQSKDEPSSLAAVVMPGMWRLKGGEAEHEDGADA
jgi:hypothetical protein